MSEHRGAATLAAQASEEVVVRTVENVHGAIARRAFALTGPAAAPVRVAHDAISTGVYAGVKVAGRALGAAAGLAWAAWGDNPRPLSSTARGRFLLGAVHGLIGDRLHDEEHDLLLHLALRHEGEDLAPTRGALRRAFPGATPKLVVFLHGLMETEDAWRFGGRRPYGDHLAEDFGMTPLYVRYNTGLPVAENGRRLAELLDVTIANWPVPVEDVTLVGHSMGGLVARSAGAQAYAAGERWVELVDHVVCLGTPHTGAPLARGVQRAASALALLPELRPFADVLDMRSAGIRDLCEGDDCPLVPHAHHWFLGASLHRDEGHLLARVVGDLLVVPASAAGRPKLRIERGGTLHLGGLNHFQLLNHPKVYAAMRRWLAATGEPVAAG